MFIINMTMNSFKAYLTLIIVAFAFPFSLCGQGSVPTADSQFRDAVTLQKNYRFSEAEAVYNKLLESDLDPARTAEIQERIIQCHNGHNLMQFIVRPTAVVTADFPTGEFFLHLQDSEPQSWIPIPNPFVNITASAANPFCTATYFGPEGIVTDRVIYSAPDENGHWKIYTSSRLDSTTWSLPQHLSPNIISGGNEIFPHLSTDGRTLYFASDGMAGMGGYDLFYSTLDPSTGSWSAPENLGFPYSSTGNDIFYSDSEDGRYTTVVSDRETKAGKVRIYVTNAIATPVKTRLETDEDPVAIASMRESSAKEEPAEKEQTQAEIPQRDGKMLEYSKLISEVNGLRAEHQEKLKKLEESRGLYAKADDWDKEFLGEIIMEVEKEAMQIKKRLDEASEHVRKVEMEFLANGIIPVVEEIPEEKPETSAYSDTKTDYTFPNNKLRSIPYIVLEQPKPKFDYTLKVGGKNDGKFAEDNTLPDGIVYQIQFAVFNKKASIKDLKGLSPVFVHKQPSGKYVHTVGLFRTYAEGSAKVKTVRNAGFKDAYLVAYKNGKSISVKNARQQEGKPVESNASWQLVISGYSDALPSGVITAIRDASHKDISKTTGDGDTLFLVGPFAQKSQAEELASLLKGLGVNGISIENVKIK